MMRTEARGEVLTVVEMTRLTAEEVALFKELVRATLGDHHRILEVDFSHVKTLDSEGVGALISVHKRMRERDGILRLLKPTPFVAQMLQLLRLDQVLEVVI
jgi:anti-sigma B factor antagonist